MKMPFTTDFRFIISDYWKLQSRLEINALIWLPLTIVVVVFGYCLKAERDLFYENLELTNKITAPILAFMLAVISFLTTYKKDSEIANSKTRYKLNNAPVTLYKYMAINVCYVIIVDLILLFCYMVGNLISLPELYTINMIMNAIYTFFVIHLLVSIIISITGIYFIITK